MSQTDQLSAGTDGAGFDHCEQCNAPVERDQRYCVNCGNHRRHVPDPAAKYLSRGGTGTGPLAGAGSSAVVAGPVAVATSADRWGGLNLLGAIALALIPVAAVVGVLIGRSSNDRDAALLAALLKQRSQVQTVLSTTSTPSASAAASSSATTAKAVKHSATKHATSKHSTKASTTATSNGSVSKITGSKVTAQQQASGSKDAQTIEKSTGKNYVQSSNNLPSTVVVGP